MILKIKNNPKTKSIIENIFNFSFEINGRGIFNARYNEIKEVFTIKIVLTFSGNLFWVY